MMTMQISSTVPAHGLHLFQTRKLSFKSRSKSRLNPSRRNALFISTVTCSVSSTKTHISNLDKLLGKQIPLDPPDPDRRQPESPSRGLLNCLNLPRLWPAMKAAEEMSPRDLNRLQRLLSASSQEYSPRNILGSRWREYHGSNNWAGLLDPLDENLRREIVRYGEFIQAAYHSFHSDPAMSADAAPQSVHVALPDKSYRVTKSLYATSSVGLPKWVDDVAPDLGWMTQRSSWIGFVSVCEDRAEIRRMGRRDITISLRGTATCLEWAENMRDLLVPSVAETHDPNPRGQPKVECGFLSLYKTRGAHVPSLAESVVEEVRRLVKLYEGETLSITVTGHSLGAALALLVADELSACMPADQMPPVSVFSFGGPRVGNRAFANRLESSNVKVLRIVNSQDVITKVPGMFVSEALDTKLRTSEAAAGVLNILDNNMPWAYAHVGTELKVDTKTSPFLKPDADVACCHDLEAYLHLVDGFLASNCPFRANAKRSIAKLMNEQRSNMKKLYTSNGKDLRLKLERRVSMPECLPSPSA
uniref:Fungal lipase-type domain-containing protein n=1 Tax=Kalanchoe fedtschenkoi TaxID=63787 RepID=A0A7N0VLZ6_KALFE